MPCKVLVGKNALYQIISGKQHTPCELKKTTKICRQNLNGIKAWNPLCVETHSWKEAT